VLFVAGVNERDAPCWKRGSWKSCSAWRPSTDCSPFPSIAPPEVQREKTPVDCAGHVARRTNAGAAERAADAGWKIVARERQTARRDQVGAKREGRADDRTKRLPKRSFNCGQRSDAAVELDCFLTRIRDQRE